MADLLYPLIFIGAFLVIALVIRALKGRHDDVPMVKAPWVDGCYFSAVPGFPLMDS